jgi:SAM-dependent methyltransferase
MTGERRDRPCPACGAIDVAKRDVAPGKLAIGGGPLVIARCRCGAAFQPHVPTTDELARWYDYMGHNPHNVQSSPLLDRRIERMVRAFEPYRKTGRLLEVGCGGGLFVHAATKAGWEVWGTEISPSCAAVLQQLMGSRLHEGTIETAGFAEASFDGAAMIEVIEHLADPLPYLASIRRLLRPGGRLFLTTPNARGAAGRVLGTKWRAFTDEHLSFFDRRSVPALLARAGFVDVEVRTTNLDLVVLAASQLRVRLSRLRRARTSMAPADDGAPAAAYARDAGKLRRAPALPTAVADLAIEAVNRFADATHLGDTLRIVARRP